MTCGCNDIDPSLANERETQYCAATHPTAEMWHRFGSGASSTRFATNIKVRESRAPCTCLGSASLLPCVRKRIHTYRPTPMPSLAAADRDGGAPQSSRSGPADE